MAHLIDQDLVNKATTLDFIGQFDVCALNDIPLYILETEIQKKQPSDHIFGVQALINDV